MNMNAMKMMVLACVAGVAMAAQAEAASLSVQLGSVVVRVSDNCCAAKRVVVQQPCKKHAVAKVDKKHKAHRNLHDRRVALNRRHR